MNRHVVFSGDLLPKKVVNVVFLDLDNLMEVLPKHVQEILRSRHAHPCSKQDPSVGTDKAHHAGDQGIKVGGCTGPVLVRHIANHDPIGTDPVFLLFPVIFLFLLTVLLCSFVLLLLFLLLLGALVGCLLLLLLLCVLHQEGLDG